MDDARLQRPAMVEPLTSRPTLIHGRRRHRSGMLLITGISLSHPAMDDWLTSDADAHHRSYATLAAAPGTSPDPATVASQNLARSGEGDPRPGREDRALAESDGQPQARATTPSPALTCGRSSAIGLRERRKKGEKRESREEERETKGQRST